MGWGCWGTVGSGAAGLIPGVYGGKHDGSARETSHSGAK